MIRKLTAALIGVGVMVPGLANALGLGGLQLDSALSEPLNARIELVQIRELGAEEILVNLASVTEFKNAGVERLHALTDVKFEVVVPLEGNPYIKLKTRKPIREPFLNFLVEVNWPAGRLLREYTLLLDPPVFRATNEKPVLSVPTVKAQQATPAPVVRTPVQPTPVVSAPRQPELDTPTPSPTSNGEGKVYGPTKSSDSLWSIARQLRPTNSVSIQQTMVAIQRLNPNAFIRGNINLLKKGQVLRGPTEQQVRELDTRDAIAMVAEQNREWKERTSAGSRVAEAAQIDTSGRAIDNQSSAPVSRPAHLKLVSAADAVATESGQGGSGSPGSAALQGELQLAEEQADQFRLETEDLKVRNSDLIEQLDTSDKVLSLKNEQIVALQSRLAELEKEMTRLAQKQAAAEGDAPSIEAVNELAAEVEAVSGVEATKPAVDFNYDGVDKDGDALPQTPDVEQAIVVEETVQTPVDAEVPVVKEQPKQDDFITTLTNNPIYMAAGVGLILILIVGAMLAGRKKEEDDEIADSLVDDFNLDGIGVADSEESFDAIEDVETEEFAEDPIDESTVPQTSDVIGEADIYIAYGRFPQAIEMLEKAAESEPDRPDIRTKLLEVAVEAGDVEVFKRHDAVLQNVGNHDHLARAAELRSKLSIDDEVSEETVLMPGADLGSDEGLNVSADVASDGDALDFDMDLSLDDDIASEEIDEVEEVPDFDLDLSEESEAVAEDGLLDFSLDEDVASVAEVDDLSLDLSGVSEVDELSLDIGTGTDDSAEEVEVDLDTEVELDFDAELDLDSELGLDDGFDLDVEPISDFSEAEESLDVDLGVEDADLGKDEVAEVSAGLEFDLDIDSDIDLAVESDDGVDAAADSSIDTDMLDSDAAAQLADELDFDTDFDTETTATEEDATVIMTPSAPTEAANEESSADLDFLTDADEISTKLDLARAYIDMGDRDGAKDILDEVMIEGSNDQQVDAKELLAKLD